MYDVQPVQEREVRVMVLWYTSDSATAKRQLALAVQLPDPNFARVAFEPLDGRCCLTPHAATYPWLERQL